MKKLTALALCLVISLSFFAACGKADPEKGAKAAVTESFNALQSKDLKKIEQYFEMDQLLIGKAQLDTDQVTSAVVEKLYGGITYEIVSTQIKDDQTVLVKIKITTIDMKPVATEFMNTFLQWALLNGLGAQPSDEEIQAKLSEFFVTALSKENLPTVSNEVDIPVVLKDEKWVMQVDETIKNAMAGGMYTAWDEIAKDMN